MRSWRVSRNNCLSPIQQNRTCDHQIYLDSGLLQYKISVAWNALQLDAKSLLRLLLRTSSKKNVILYVLCHKCPSEICEHHNALLMMTAAMPPKKRAPNQSNNLQLRYVCRPQTSLFLQLHCTTAHHWMNLFHSSGSQQREKGAELRKGQLSLSLSQAERCHSSHPTSPPLSALCGNNLR